MTMTASADATIQAALQTIIRADSGHFASANVTLGDVRGLDKGLESANYVVIFPGTLTSAARSGTGGQITQVWEHPVILYNRWRNDEYATHTAARDDILDIINANPTLGGTTGISNSVASGATLNYLYPRGGGDTPTYVLTTITVMTQCEIIYGNSGEFA